MLHRKTSKNGLRILLEEVPYFRSVTIGIWIKTGSRNENSNNNGISHLIEHMLFKGTRTRTAQEIAESFDAIGGEINAFTSKEYTCYYAKVLDTHKEIALDILADMFFESIFDEQELEREKKVIKEEINMYEDTPDDLVHDLLATVSYKNHPLAMPILGTSETLDRFTPADIREYIQANYGPRNVIISVAGNVDEAFIKKVDQYFGSYTTESRMASLETPAFIPESMMKNKQTEQAHICLGFEGYSETDDRLYSLTLMNNILGGSMSSKLFQEIREKQGLAYTVFSYHSSFDDSGMLTIYGGTGKHQLKKLEANIDMIIDKLLHDGITEQELANNKEQLKGSLVLDLESTTSRMERNARNEFISGKEITVDETIEKIDAVTHKDLTAVINDIFSRRHATAIIT